MELLKLGVAHRGQQAAGSAHRFSQIYSDFYA